MPWQPEDAPAHNALASTPRRQTLWSNVANEERRKTGNDAQAIKMANAALDRYVENGKKRNGHS